MAPQRYEAVRFILPKADPFHRLTISLQVNSHDHDDDSHTSPSSPHAIPTSPPPSFRSRASSPTSRRLLGQDPSSPQNDRDHLEDTFDDGEASDTENDRDDRQRLMRAETGLIRQDATPTTTDNPTSRPAPYVERRVTELPAFRAMPQSSRATDGVFANLSAKPEPGVPVEEKPPVSLDAMHPGITILIVSRRTSKQPQMQRHPIGRPLSSPPACPRMKSTSTAYLWAPSSPSSGTA